MSVLLIFNLTDGLCHGSHGAEGAPCARLEEHHHDDSDKGGGKHQAIKTKGKLSYPIGNKSLCIGPSPGHADSPEELERFLKILCTCGYKICIEYHNAEHGKEKHEESVAEVF